MAGNRRKKTKKQLFKPNIGEKFTLSYWRHNYSSAALLIVACIYWYRRTTDGLLFIAPIFIALAWRFELCKKFDVPFALWRREKETLRNFGYARAFTSMICPSLVHNRSENDYPVQMVWRLIFTLLILHICICIVIVAHAVNPNFIDSIFIHTNSYFDLIFNNWPSYIRVEEGLIDHGYEYRIPIIKNSYALSILAILYIYISFIVNLFKIKKFYEFNEITIYNFKSLIKYKKNNKFVYTVCEIYYIVLLLIGCIAAIYFLFYYASLPILYPGEPPPRHGRGLWLASYAYRDNIALFSPLYLVLIPSLAPLIIVMVVISNISLLYRRIKNGRQK